MPGWRSLTVRDRKEFLLDLQFALALRAGPDSMGHEKYGETFEGDPLEQAWQEALDLVFYLWIEQRRRRRHAKR